MYIVLIWFTDTCLAETWDFQFSVLSHAAIIRIMISTNHFPYPDFTAEQVELEASATASTGNKLVDCN